VNRLFAIILALSLTACNLPRAGTPTLSAPPETPTIASTDCAFVEGRQTLPELSKQFVGKLKEAGLPVDTARVEAYGENCIAPDNTVVRFAARETDFYITLNVAALTDESALGNYLETILIIIGKIPPDQTGPNPGYIGVTFKAGDQVQNLWFTQTLVNDLQTQGLKGAELYRALKNKP